MAERPHLETHEFQSEAKQVLELMIHSVYSNPDIFLRELISNASDALDKLRIESLSDETLSDLARDGKIVVAVDPAERTITVSDNGVGMTHDELVSYLGTIAKSGTKEFIRAMQEAASSGDLIGQFGVGFYSSFIVAKSVTVTTRKAGTSEAWQWASAGDGTYTIVPAEKETHGTDIVLTLKDRESYTEDDLEPPKDYASSWTLRTIVKQYSDFVSYPIYLEDRAKKKEDAGEEEAPEPVNSMKAIWIRPESEVSDEEYREFYRHVTHDWEDPLERIVYRAEGTNEFHALLYIPAHPPMDLFYRDGKHGVQLYIRRVFIMNDCRDMIPEYLRFVKGVVDSEDLSLNVSRELLQQDRQTAMIKRGLTRKVLDTLKKMKNERPEDYKKFWDTFGIVLKEGIVQDAKNRDAVLKLCFFDTSSGTRTTLEEYVGEMKDGQENIYYLTGAPLATLAHSPKLEMFRKRGIQVLLLADPVDEFWVGSVGKYEEHGFISIASEEVALPKTDETGDEEVREEAKKLEDAGFAAKLKETLSHLDGIAKSVEDVKISTRLVDSPATFVQKGEPLSPHMRAMWKAMGQEAPAEKRVLEINPTHGLIQKISQDTESERLDEWAALLLGLASIADGEPVENGPDFTASLSKLLNR